MPVEFPEKIDVKLSTLIPPILYPHSMVDIKEKIFNKAVCSTIGSTRNLRNHPIKMNLTKLSLYKLAGAAVLASIIISATTAIAQDGAGLYAARACVACHGADGTQPINDSTPKIAGQNKGYLIQQMKDIKSGARNNGLSIQMKGLVANLSDEDIEAISEYLSGL